MDDATLGRWLREELPRLLSIHESDEVRLITATGGYAGNAQGAFDALTALVALLREADSYIVPSYVQGGVIAFKDRLRTVLGAQP